MTRGQRGVPLRGGDGLQMTDIDKDVVAASELAHLICFQNPGAKSKVGSGQWPRTIPRRTQARGSWIRVFFGDYDGDGRLDQFADKPIPWLKLPDHR